MDVTWGLTTMASVPNAVRPVLPSALAGVFGPACFTVPFVDRKSHLLTSVAQEGSSVRNLS